MSAAHDAHDHFDNEPATELGPDETRTANWVPYLGLALFFSAGVACLIGGDDEKAAADKPVAAEAQAAPVAQPQKMPEIQARQAAPVQPTPVGQGDPNPLKRLSPEQAKELQKLIEQRQRQQGGAPPQPGTPPQPGAVPQPPNPVH